MSAGMLELVSHAVLQSTHWDSSTSSQSAVLSHHCVSLLTIRQAAQKNGKSALCKPVQHPEQPPHPTV